jgi:hypothetical protein
MGPYPYYKIMMATYETDQIIEIPEEKTYLKAEIKEIWTPHIIIAKNVSDMDIYHYGYIKIIETGEKKYIEGYPWNHRVICNSFFDDYESFLEELGLFIDMSYLNIEELYKKEPLVLISLNDLKDKKPGDIIMQKRFGENLIFSFYSHCILYPRRLFKDFYYLYIKPLYQTIDPKEFPYFKICVTLRSAELSLKTIKNDLYEIEEIIRRYKKDIDPEFVTKTNDSLNKDRDAYIIKYFLAHFKEDYYLKKEFFEPKYIKELYKVLESEPIRFNNEGKHLIKPPKDPYKDIQKLKKKIEDEFKDSLIYKAIRSYNFSLK